MSPARGAIAVASFVLAGCSYHNTVYNAERLYTQAEGHRREGRDSLATARYLDVVRKTGQALRARAGAEWAPDALFLLGRSHLRLGDLRAANAALTQAVRTAPDEHRRGQALVYVAAVQAELGDPAAAMENVGMALSGALEGPVLADAHMLRGRLLLEGGFTDQGWWDMDRAEEADDAVGVEAGLERLRWTVHHGDRPRTGRALDALFSHSEAGVRLDSIAVLVRGARDQWGPARAADLLSGVAAASWDGAERGRAQLLRAELLREAGDAAGADATALLVANGIGPVAAEARLLVASWRAREARDLGDVYGLRPSLLPSGDDPRVARRLGAIDDLERLAVAGLEDPLGWFAAGEVARDQLGAGYLARGLFLAYADQAPTAPWTPKALLAALESSPDEGDRAWLRGRLEVHARSPYVLAARGGSAAGLEALEEDLAVRLRELVRQ